jgi:hypothetical protein
MQYQKTITRLFVAIISYGFIIFLFSRALVSPEDNINFIFNVGIFIFLTEFLSMHSAVMFSNPKWNLLQKLFLLSVYLIFVLVGSYVTHSFYPGLIFALSLVAKSFYGSNTNQYRLIFPAFIFMGTAFFSVIMASVITIVFPFPAAVLSQKDPNSSGVFVDQPQTLLVWGILYYIGLIAMEIWLLKKTDNTQSTK